ncbi:MAG: HlyD family type I secretion periplasmic adaptor subunit [Jannaschia sp.]
MQRNGTETGLLDRKKAADQSRAPRTAKALVLVLTLLLAGTVLWSARTEVRELTRAEGEIVPRGHLTHIEHFDGGMLADILVKPGDRVVADQVLARLTSPDLGRTERELDQERRILADHKDMLDALIAGDPADPVAGSYATTRRDLYLSRAAMLRDRAQGRAAALAIARSARSVARERQTLGEVELTRLRKLFESGYLPQARISAQGDLLQTIRGDLLNAETVLSRAMTDEADARAAMVEAELSYRQNLQEELFNVVQDITRVDLRLGELAAQRRRLDVRSPAAGIVQSVATTTRGEVIEAGERLFEILPTTVGLVADIRVTPEDIGHIAIGDPVKLTPTSFDTRRYGHLAGTIARISPTSTLDPRGHPYFSVEVGLDGTTLGRGPFQGEISPGMVVLAEMETSRRTVMQYLLKPIDQSLAMAMTER